MWVGGLLNEPGGLEPEPSPAGPGKGRGTSAEGSTAVEFTVAGHHLPFQLPKEMSRHFMILFLSMPVLLSPWRF